MPQTDLKSEPEKGLIQSRQFEEPGEVKEFNVMTHSVTLCWVLIFG